MMPISASSLRTSVIPGNSTPCSRIACRSVYGNCCGTASGEMLPAGCTSKTRPWACRYSQGFARLPHVYAQLFICGLRPGALFHPSAAASVKIKVYMHTTCYLLWAAMITRCSEHSRQPFSSSSFCAAGTGFKAGVDGKMGYSQTAALA